MANIYVWVDCCRPVVTMTEEDARALRILERICGPVKDGELDTNNHEENILISL